MRRQVGNNGGEIIVIRVEFIAELIVEIFFDGSRHFSRVQAGRSLIGSCGV